MKIFDFSGNELCKAYRNNQAEFTMPEEINHD